MSAPWITCVDCQALCPRYAQDRCKRCYGRGRRTGTLPMRHRRRPWTARENAYLEREYLNGSHACARSLGRTPEAVRHQVLRLGLRLTTEYRLTDLAVAVGAHPSTARIWRKRGKLTARGRGYLCEAALHRFFCEQRALWTKYPCPDRAWIESLLTDARLRRAHGCVSPVREERIC